MKTACYFVLILASTLSLAAAQEHDHANHNGMHCPMSAQQRADQGMGFSQDKTTHHFTLTHDGGVIAVEVNDPKDTESRDQIRMHMAHVAKAFAGGDFDIPMFVHDQVPDGVPVMKARKDQIKYVEEETGHGARVVIRTQDKETLAAVHDFLMFQIREHKTGDSVSIQ